MTFTALTYLFLAYGIFWFVPLALLVVILVRLNHLSREIAALRRRLGSDADRWQSQGQDPTIEGA